jgi:hypothetical protein
LRVANRLRILLFFPLFLLLLQVFLGISLDFRVVPRRVYAIEALMKLINLSFTRVIDALHDIRGVGIPRVLPAISNYRSLGNGAALDDVGAAKAVLRTPARAFARPLLRRVARWPRNIVLRRISRLMHFSPRRLF